MFKICLGLNAYKKLVYKQCDFIIFKDNDFLSEITYKDEVHFLDFDFIEYDFDSHNIWIVKDVLKNHPGLKDGYLIISFKRKERSVKND